MSIDYNGREPTYITQAELTEDEYYKLTKSDSFCMLPWVHIHSGPNGNIQPCCMADYAQPYGNLKEISLVDAWNNAQYKKLRVNMIEDKSCSECTNCYNQEKSGFFSMRNSSNKQFGQHIKLLDKTHSDGHFDEFKIRQYDIRFSNLCNFSCRTCGPGFSSSWYQDANKLNGFNEHTQILFAGKTRTDMWEQMQEHIPYLEQIYFAGGEPLIMEEHYQILKELVRLKRFDVRLIYNTNFSKLNLKDENVLDYWKLFDSVAIGASLDDSYERGEYVRKGTKWDIIVRNRELMIEQCPKVDFYVSSTVSLMNAWHVSDFHREWVEKGLINAGAWNINILMDANFLRIDNLPDVYKDEINTKLKKHIEWLQPQDPMTRATVGYESMIKFMYQDSKPALLKEFFKYTDKLDVIRNEKFEDTFPEYKDLRKYI